nr:protein TOPAZ1 [Labrus bergylta]
MRDRPIERVPGPEYPHRGPELCGDKRIKLGDSGEEGSLPSTPDLESIICKNPITSDSKIQEKTHSCESHDSQSGSERVRGVASSCTFGPDVTVNSIHEKQFSETESPTDPFSPSAELDTGEPESFTCQRVRVYSRKIHSSCTRTYMPWPFSKSSWTLTSHAETTAHHAEYFDPFTKDNCFSSVNQNQSDLSSKRTNDVIPHLPADLSTDGLTHLISHHNENKKEHDGKCFLAERNGVAQGDMSSYSSERRDMEFAPHLMDAEESKASLSSDTASLSIPSQHGAVSPSSSVVSGPKTDSSMSTPSPTSLGLINWDTATTMSSPFTLSGLSRLSNLPPSLFLPNTVTRIEFAEAHSAGTSPGPPSPTCAIKSVAKPLPTCERTPMISCHTSESFPSPELSLTLLPQEERDSDGELLTDRFPPKLEPFYNTSPYNPLAPVKERSLHNVSTENCVENDSIKKFMLPPVLSPVTSPKRHSPRSILPGLSSDSSDEEPLSQEEEEEEISKEPIKHKMLIEFNSPHIVNDKTENLEDGLEHVSKGIEGVSRVFKTLNTVRSELQSSPCNDEDSDNDGDEEEEEESQNETDYEEDFEQVNKVHSDTKITATRCLDSLASDQDDGGAYSDEERPCSFREEASSPCNSAGGETDQMSSEDILTEFTAYEQDILLVDVIQDDPELFENLPQRSILKLGPIRDIKASKSRPIEVVKTLFAKKDGAPINSGKRLTPVNIDFQCDSPDNMDESSSRSWRPQSNGNPTTKQSSSWTDQEKHTKTWDQYDANNNHVNGGLERITPPLKTVTSQHNHIPTLKTIKNGPRNTNPANVVELRRQQSNSYCRQYFSESLCCRFKMCWFLHVPVDGDEKFCIETVIRFTKNPICLQRAGAVFTGYYQNNPPGVYFSKPVLLSLLWALLKAGMVSDIFSVLSISLAHKIVPGHEFLLALFNYVREKSLIGLLPELMQLTLKLASAGLVLNLDCLDCVKHTPEFQQTNSHVSGSGSGTHKLSASAPFPEYLNWAHSIVEIELCAKQEDWRRMGEVFRSICQSSQRPNQVERISGRITIALLSESKDKLSLPFAAFAETVCQNEEEEGLNRSFLGRIGVSLMLRYHKTHQWAKGRRVVEVLSNCKVNYSNLKGLFGNEDATSRCFLVTVATELYLLSGSVEGALNTLRENKWFVSSSAWPCEPADLESRTRVLMRLAEKSSHRDSLDVLSNLPGLKESNNLVDISMYAPLFNSHLQVCLDRQTLPVASDTVDFMCSKNLAVDQTMLQKLLHKLGKQNLWLRAREVFRHSLSVGYYPGVSAPPGFMSLNVPCRLGEVELALSFEMFITVNTTDLLHLPENTTSCLSITLKRTQSCESEYLAASSRLLSAACIPHPKLDVLYTAVNSSQEQVFTLDIASARAWLRQNHLWAHEVWTH